MREVAMKLLAELRAVALETQIQFLVKACEFTQSDDPRVVGVDGSKAMLICA